MNKNKEPRWKNQRWAIIETQIQRRSDIYARIYSEEQRDTLQNLINKGYVPTETIVGRAKCTRKHWNLEPYSGKRGEGYRMISSYPWSSNFNSITFFIKQVA
ncbi:MAG: hypothetical protein KBT06_08515 [Prevotellaceae bacterium]|nr:hypothetical protein [Candidatus Colivivens equi]